MFAAFLCTVLFSISVTCAHRGARLIGGTEANFWRLAPATLFLGLWAYGFGIGLGGNAFPVFLASGMVGIGLGDVALFQALPRLGSRLSLLIINALTAPLGALIEWFWLGTTLSLGQVLCGLVILTGVGIALTPGEHVRHTRREAVVGTLWCLASALGGAWGAVLSRKAYALVHASGQHLNAGNAAFQRAIGGLLIAGLCLLVVKRQALKLPLEARPDPDVEACRGGSTLPEQLQTAKRKWSGVWPWILINALAGQTLGVSCMQWALERTPSGLVLAIIAMTPVVIIPFALVIERERPSFISLFGGAIAVAGVVALTLFR